jgi:hypothetical protein
MTKPMTINDTTVTTVLNLAVSFMPRMSIHVMPATIAAAGTSSSIIRTAVFSSIAVAFTVAASDAKAECVGRRAEQRGDVAGPPSRHRRRGDGQLQAEVTPAEISRKLPEAHGDVHCNTSYTKHVVVSPIARAVTLVININSP